MIIVMVSYFKGFLLHERRALQVTDESEASEIVAKHLMASMDPEMTAIVNYPEGASSKYQTELLTRTDHA